MLKKIFAVVLLTLLVAPPILASPASDLRLAVSDLLVSVLEAVQAHLFPEPDPVGRPAPAAQDAQSTVDEPGGDPPALFPEPDPVG